MTTKPFHKIIQQLYNKKVIRFDVAKPEDARLQNNIEKVCMDVCNTLKQNPIESKRVNEVGNKIEPYVIDSFKKINGYKASVPCNRKQGYPDVLVEESNNRYTYIECKTYSRKNAATTFRAFYFSESKIIKVQYNARHLVLGFEVEEIKPRQYPPQYRPVGFKMVDAHSLDCTLKKEWNSNNKLLYGLPLLLEYHE